MNLLLSELNELVYCLGRVIAEDPKGWNIEGKRKLYDKLYTELETRNAAVEASMREQGFIRVDEFVKQLDADMEAQDDDDEFIDPAGGRGLHSHI